MMTNGRGDRARDTPYRHRDIDHVGMIGARASRTSSGQRLMQQPHKQAVYMTAPKTHVLTYQNPLPTGGRPYMTGGSPRSHGRRSTGHQKSRKRRARARRRAGGAGSTGPGSVIWPRGTREAEAGVVGLVADQQHQRDAVGARGLHAPRRPGRGRSPRLAKSGIDGERSEQQRAVLAADQDRREAHGGRRCARRSGRRGSRARRRAVPSRTR